MSKLWEKIKKLVPTWKRSKELEEENANLLLLAAQWMDINKGLNLAAGELYRQAENVRAEAIHLLSAIAFQYGGEITVKSEFFNVLAEPGNANLNLRIIKQDDGSVVLKLVEDDTPEPEEE